MKRSMFVAAFMFCAAVVQAAVMPFSYYTRPDGTPLLIPQVREYKAGVGSVKFPAAVTVSAPKGEELIVEEIAAELKRFPEIKVAAGEGDAFFRFVVSDKDVPQDPEGYTLAVTDKGVTVSSRTTDGLFRGAQTLRDIIADAAVPELKCCRIVDWPDLSLRGYTFNLRGTPRKSFKTVLKTIDALSRFKINTVFISMEETFPYKNNPFTLNKRGVFPREDLEKLVDFCRRRHVEIIPTTQVLSHTLWMTYHPDWEKMSEGTPRNPWLNACCPLNEQAREITKRVLEEQIDFYKPTFYYIVYDEIYLCPFHKCPRCRKEDPKKILADYLEFVRGVLRGKGVKMILCHDSFINKNGDWPLGEWYRTRLEPGDVIRFWSYRDKLPEHQFAPFKGLELIGNAICGKPLNLFNMAHLAKKYGGDGCNMTYWYYSQGGVFAKLATETPDSLGGIVNGADYMWKLRKTPYPLLGYDGTFEMMRRMYPEKITLPPRTGEASVLPLGEVVNSELSGSGKFPRFASDAEVNELKAVLAKLPERFELLTAPGGKYYAVRLAGSRDAGRKAVKIDFQERKAKHLSFLLTCSRPVNARDYCCITSSGVKKFDYAPAASLTVNYADGSKKVLKLGYRKAITDWNRPFGGFDMRFVARGVDADKNYYSFGVYDFKNPDPDKTISSIVFGTAMLDGISPALLAVSAWNLDKPFAGKPFDPAAAASRPGVKDEPPSKPDVICDFENGMGNVEIEVPESVAKTMKTAIVADPTSPSGSKVLKITIPPGDYEGRVSDGGFVRVNVDLPYRYRDGVKTLSLDHRLVADPSDFSFCTNYLLGSKLPGGGTRHTVQTLCPHDRWEREIFPVFSPKSKFHKDPSDVQKRRLSYFFRKIEHPVEIYVDDLGDSKSDATTIVMWRENGEAEPY